VCSRSELSDEQETLLETTRQKEDGRRKQQHKCSEDGVLREVQTEGASQQSNQQEEFAGRFDDAGEVSQRGMQLDREHVREEDRSATCTIGSCCIVKMEMWRLLTLTD
jgi:hypothetical protein